MDLLPMLRYRGRDIFSDLLRLTAASFAYAAVLTKVVRPFLDLDFF
jgi:hypothetical protein